MKKQRYEYSDGTSNKFWIITLQGSECLIEYGRIDSMGVSQAKEFGTREDAHKAFDKLISEKKAKGYRLVSEVSDEGGSAPTDINKHAPATPSEFQSAGHLPSARAPKPEKAPPAHAQAQSSAQSPAQPTAKVYSPYLPSDPDDVMSVIRLDPRDWFWAKWRNLSALELPPEQPFDQQLTVKRLAKLASKRITEVPWISFDLPINMSKTEAHFWLSAMTGEVRSSAKEIAAVLNERTFGEINFAQAQEQSKYFSAAPEIIIPLFNLMPFEKLVETIMTSTGKPTSQLAFGFGRYVIPYLTQIERAPLANQIRSRLNPARLQERVHWHWAPPEFYLAAHLGMHEEVLAVVSKWQREADWAAFGTPQQIVFGLCDPTLVSKYIQGFFAGRSFGPASLRAWIAHTGFTGLDFVYECVANRADTEACLDYLYILDLFPAPHIVRYVLQLHEIAAAKIRLPARKWMERNKEVAIQVLTELVQQDKGLAKAAQEMLNNLNAQASPQNVQASAQNLAAAPAIDSKQDDDQSIQAQISDDANAAVYDQGTTPPWLDTAVQSVKADKKMKSVDWITASNLPPIVVNQKQLSLEQKEAVLMALKASTLASPHALITQLKSRASYLSLDLFVWDLFERWLKEDGPIKEKWAMASLGLMGSDKTALKLAPLIRKWPGESFHQRAIFGLECLEKIGTDTALMLINGIAQRLKYKPLQEKANACMNGIADARNMSREALEDRIVPDCDLNGQGTRVFDFGPRQFTLLVGGDLLPMVQDKDGLPRADLPKANAADDARKAQEAIEEWKLLKKQLKEILKIQAVRLEEAMIKQRHWSVPDFENLLVKHPLLGHIVRRVIWLAFDADGQPIGTFRVTGACTYENPVQAPFDLDRAAEVAIAHTMQFGEDAFRAWQAVLAQYPISPPFAQLNRQVYSLPADTELDTELNSFDDVFVSEENLVRTLESRGWTRGAAGDNGIFEEHTKVFDCDRVTAVVQYNGVGMQGMGGEKQSIDRLFFLPGKQRKKIVSDADGALPLGDIDLIVISEVLADLHFIAAKGEVGSIKSD